MCVCFLFSLSVEGGGRRAAGSAVVFLGVCFSRLQMLGKLGSKYGFLGMDRKPQSFSLTVCCVIPLWNDGIIACCAHFKLPRVLTHILGKFHYSVCNPHSVFFFVRIFSSLPLLCPLGAPTVAEMSALSDATVKSNVGFSDNTSANQAGNKIKKKKHDQERSDSHYVQVSERLTAH